MNRRSADGQAIERLARLLHTAPARSVREALRQNPDGLDLSDARRLRVLYAEIVELELACVKTAAALFDVLGEASVAEDVRGAREEILDVMDAARISRRVCEGCGCTEFNACPNGCEWVDHTLCSRCADRSEPKKDGRFAHRPVPVP